jgi:DNA-binding transcriptional LysR family regulator
MRNLDLTALRSFVAVADHGGVTKAAGILNFTQSAVSMQIKRLEDLLGLALLERANRRVSLTPAGEQLLGYARRMIDINDEAVSRMTSTVYEGEIVLGVPHDIIYPVIPQVLQRFNTEFPRVKVNLISSYTKSLIQEFAQGVADIILTTEVEAGAGGETIARRSLKWVGARDGGAWRQRPLRLAYVRACAFRPVVIKKLDDEGVEWEMAVDTESDRTIEATVSADLAIHTMIEGTWPPHLEEIQHGGDLPELDAQKVNMYQLDRGMGEVHTRLADMLRVGFANW